MMPKAINGRWVIQTTNAIAEWDGLTGDPSIDTGWEACRFRSMQRLLHYGHTFYDIGTEHGAISTVIAREFVGAENMVLMEPSVGLWPNIKLHWLHNGLARPLGFWPGFVSDETNLVGDGHAPGSISLTEWPPCADGHETGAMDYRSLTAPGEIPAVTLDDFVNWHGCPPRALNIDVEGAEGKVLRGAVVTITQWQPYIWVSIHPNLMKRDFDETKEELLRWVDEYLLYDAEHLGTDHEEHWLLTPRVEF